MGRTGKISVSAKAEAVAMYQKGCSTRDICEKLNVCTSELYRYIRAAGIQPRTRKPSHLRVIPGLENKTPIFDAEIEAMRKSIKVGDVINIRTQKGLSDGETGISAIPGVMKKAKVVDVSNKRFCIVEVANGIRDCILWSSFIIAERTGRNWV